MTKKTMMGALSAILLAGCAQFAEMEETRVAGNSYLTGRFYEQIGELETLAAKSPELGYSTARIVQEILPPKGSGTAWVARTKYSKIEYPMTKEEFTKWMNTIDGNIAKLKDKINAAAEEAKRKEEERIAKEKAAAEEAKRKEEERITEAAKIVAAMPESEKFPLLSVQPKPQMLMKGVPSGASMKWVQGWLLANHIKHEDPANLLDGSRVVIDADFYDKKGIRINKAEFLFFNDVLVEIKIYPRDFTVTVAVAKDKYVQQFGTSAKVEEEEKSCYGKVWYSEFSRTGFPVSKEGVVAVYTDDLVAGIKYYVTDDRWCDQIRLTDRILSKYAEETIQRKKEAEAKAKEDTKKAESAAALDF